MVSSSLPSASQVWEHKTPLTSCPEYVDVSERWIWVVLTRRKAGVTREQFVEHYEKIHPRFSLAMPGLLCYRQCVLSEEAGPGGMKMDQYDAMSEYHYVSKEAWQQAMATEVGKELDDDSALFMDMERMMSFEPMRARVL